MGQGLEVRLNSALPTVSTFSLDEERPRRLSLGSNQYYTFVRNESFCTVEGGNSKLKFDCKDATVLYSLTEDQQATLWIRDRYGHIFSITEKDTPWWNSYAETIDTAWNQNNTAADRIAASKNLILSNEEIYYQIGVAALVNMATSSSLDVSTQLAIGDCFNSVELRNFAQFVGTTVARNGRFSALNQAKGAQLVATSGDRSMALELYDQIFFSASREDGPALLLILSGYISLGDQKRAGMVDEAITRMTGSHPKPVGKLAQARQ